MSVLALPERFIRYLHASKFKRSPISKELLGLRVFYVDLSPLRLRFSDRSPLIEIRREELRQRTPEEIMGTLKDIILQSQIQDRISIALLDGCSAELRRLANEPPYHVVLLDEDDMKQIMESRTPSDELLAHTRYQVPLSFLSPYEVSAPVTGGQFFGREYETRTILNHPDTCYMIIGARRIGKTSVLQEVQRRMKAADSETTKYIFYDCMAYSGKRAFFELVISTLYPNEYLRLSRMGAEDYAGYFPRFMARMKNMYKGRIVFFMDEVDHLLEADREKAYELMKILRACFEQGSCRFIFAGFQEAQRQLGEDGSGLNFSTRLSLGNLSHSQAAELVGIPMNNLGVKIISREQVIRHIYQETAGHPNFIQHYCLALMRQLDETGVREITPEHLAKLPDDEGFRDRVLETFVFNTNDLEKAIAYAVADKGQFCIEDVDKQMKRRRLLLEIREIEEACRKLGALGVVERTGQAFRFTLPVFPQLLRERYGGEFLFEKANEYHKLRRKEGELP